METNNNEDKLTQVAGIAHKLMPKLPYHNFNHTIDVYLAVSTIANLEELNSKDKFLLKTAALLHDTLFENCVPYNEKRSAKIAREYLPPLSYSSIETEIIAKLILATELPTSPKNLLEKIICDADLDYLGREDFFERSEKLRQELGLPKKLWVYKQLQFLENHKYYTEAARRLRDKGKQENIRKSKKLIRGKKVKC